MTKITKIYICDFTHEYMWRNLFNSLDRFFPHRPMLILTVELKNQTNPHATPRAIAVKFQIATINMPSDSLISNFAAHSCILTNWKVRVWRGQKCPCSIPRPACKYWKVCVCPTRFSKSLYSIYSSDFDVSEQVCYLYLKIINLFLTTLAAIKKLPLTY